MNFANYRKRGDVDNLLSNFLWYGRGKITDLNIKDWTIMYKDMNVAGHRCYYIDDAVDTELAKAAREFAMNIPFDNKTLPLNDTDNQAQDNLCKALSVDKVLTEGTTNSFDWKWENYLNKSIWRGCPKTYDAYYCSPICRLMITVLESWTKLLAILYTDTSNLYFGCWVLQRNGKGNSIDWHTDDCPGRRLAFLYYLTPDDWTDSDGGYLLVQKENTIRVHPTFNKLIFWTMDNTHTSPPHSVEKVLTDTKARIALVGFFYEKK